MPKRPLMALVVFAIWLVLAAVTVVVIRLVDPQANTRIWAPLSLMFWGLIVGAVERNIWRVW